MYEVRVEADFAAAHFLRDYHGKCERLHGHNYRVEAYASGEVLDRGGMLLDFAVFKSALRAVCDDLDHTNLNDIAAFDQNPSAERIAKYIFDALEASLAEQGADAAMLSCVDVFETPTSRARYSRD